MQCQCTHQQNTTNKRVTVNTIKRIDVNLLTVLTATLLSVLIYKMNYTGRQLRIFKPSLPLISSLISWMLMMWIASRHIFLGCGMKTVGRGESWSRLCQVTFGTVSRLRKQKYCGRDEKEFEGNAVKTDSYNVGLQLREEVITWLQCVCRLDWCIVKRADMIKS